MRLEPELSRSAEIVAIVREGMRRHTETCVPWEEYADLTIVARSDEGAVVGAVFGETGRGWLHISVVWVDEKLRCRGMGSQLVQAAEMEARRRGCAAAYLDTFSYQARPFYEKLGYVAFGTLDDYPKGHQRFYLRKRLDAG